MCRCDEIVIKKLKKKIKKQQKNKPFRPPSLAKASIFQPRAGGWNCVLTGSVGPIIGASGDDASFFFK